MDFRIGVLCGNLCGVGSALAAGLLPGAGADGAFALYGVLEQFVLNGFMNPFILLTGILLYPGLLRTDTDGGANGKVSYSSNS